MPCARGRAGSRRRLSPRSAPPRTRQMEARSAPRSPQPQLACCTLSIRLALHQAEGCGVVSRPQPAPAPRLGSRPPQQIRG